MLRYNLCWALSGVLVLTSCSDRQSRPVAETARPTPPSRESSVSMDVVSPAVAHADVATRSQSVALGVPAAPAMDRMIVRTATLTLQVADVRRTVDEISRATLAANGFLGASRLWREADHDRATMTLRVPAPRLDATLASLRSLAVRVDDEAVSGDDVTGQAVDLRAQLTNLRATEVELRALLTTVRQKTGKASEVLEVHAELSRIRGEIERADGALQSLTQLAALSTITLELRPDVVAAPIATDSWQPRGVLRDATRALVGTLRMGISVAIWAMVYGLPLLAAVGGLAMLLGRLFRSIRNARIVSSGAQ